MKYQDAMELLSQFELGAVLLSDDNIILSINEAGDRLLHGEGNLVGSTMPETAALLCEDASTDCYVNIAFGEYLTRCTTPKDVEIPPNTHMLVFRVSTNDACHDMLINVLNGIDKAVILFDTEGRLYLLNDAAAKVDSMITSDVMGKHVSELYHMADGQAFAIPQVIQEKYPKRGLHQNYTTCFGKSVDILANVSPIIQNGQTLGAYNILDDLVKTSRLQRIQNSLFENASSRKTKEKNTPTAKYQFQNIIHISSSMQKMVSRCQLIAQSDSSVMIYGETGTGKELLAQSIHNASRRADGPFLAINCAAIPDNLFEGLLFGTEKGAYTGAENRIGLFEQAHGGTLLLDEINSMNMLLQSKLLRVLQEGTLRRVGGSKDIHIDVRVLSNINTPPLEAIKENKLRQDLFYRLGVININIPPLRNHKEDIPLLSKNFILRFNETLLKNVSDIDRATLEIFNAYHWPGNIRELEHAIEHAMSIIPYGQSSVITPDYLPDHILNVSPSPLYTNKRDHESINTLNSTVQNMEHHILRNALLKNNCNITRTAQSFGVSRQNLQYRIKRCGINVKTLMKNK